MKKQEAVVSHWSVLIDDFQASGQQFFAAVEANVQARRIPGVRFRRITFRESGAFSDRREYLRIQRDDLIFDVGASPYGTGFFFSWWLVRSRGRFRWLYLLGFLVTFGVITRLIKNHLGLGTDDITELLLASGAAFVMTLLLMLLLGKMGALGSEEHIAAAPLVGWLYRRFGNPVTYHSLDLVSMYQESIRRCVNEAVDATLKEQGRATLASEERLLAIGDGASTPVAIPARR